MRNGKEQDQPGEPHYEDQNISLYQGPPKREDFNDQREFADAYMEYLEEQGLFEIIPQFRKTIRRCLLRPSFWNKPGGTSSGHGEA